jgi:hypothetical protein
MLIKGEKYTSSQASSGRSSSPLSCSRRSGIGAHCSYSKTCEELFRRKAPVLSTICKECTHLQKHPVPIIHKHFTKLIRSERAVEISPQKAAERGKRDNDMRVQAFMDSSCQCCSSCMFSAIVCLIHQPHQVAKCRVYYHTKDFWPHTFFNVVNPEFD